MLTREGAGRGNTKGNSGRRWEDTMPTGEGAGSGRTQGRLWKAQVGGHKADSGRRRDGQWEDARLTREAQGVGGHKADSGRRRECGDKANSGRHREWEDKRQTLEGAGSGRIQGRLGKAQGVGGHRANSGRRSVSPSIQRNRLTISRNTRLAAGSG
jgi:hypothetical protein